jgi:hypothetical protein
MTRFSKWLEWRLGQDPQQMRRIMMDYLDLKLDPKKGMTITMDTLGPRTVHHIAEKIKGWTILDDKQKESALSVIYQPNSTLGDLSDALASGGPRPVPGPEQSAAEGL